MPKFFCDYCDVYLTHDSMSVRKAHNSGRNHLRNVIDYYQQIGHEKAQSVIDSITSSYAAEGQAHANPMLPQNQPGGGMGGMGGAFPPPLPFSFAPGGAPPPPFPGMPPGAAGAGAGLPIPPPGAFGHLPPPGGAGRGAGMPPMPPFMPNPTGAGPPIPPPGFPLPAGMPPFPLPPGGGAPGPAGSPPANFQFPPHMPPFNPAGPPGHGDQR